MPDTWSDPLEQRLDRLVSTGRQLVEGVSGSRPGSRSASRQGSLSRQGSSGEGRRLRLDGLGRWVENKLEWILEDEDDWREPWQEPQRRPDSSWRQEPAPVISRRRPLDAISRRQPSQPSATDASEWPEDQDFTVPRWQRQPSSEAGARSQPAPPFSPEAPRSSSPARALPRSTRRRSAG
jgi:hypothetical protein